MCGLVGFVDPRQASDTHDTLIRHMADAIAHRGPDSDGYWVEGVVAFGHRRLAIIDLSELGAQPMPSPTGRYMMIFNGEIYNFMVLRDQLLNLGFSFRGHSDTEVMLAAIEAWGVEAATQQFVGMFAFALWDRDTRTLCLGRDRLGEKPLYYGWSGGVFFFGSELKAFRPHPRWQATLNPDSIAMHLRYNYIPTPYTVYQGIYKLPPATLLSLSDWESQQLPTPQPYWSLRDVLHQDPLDLGEAEAIAELDRLLRQSVQGQMISDVPLGAFLSGGIDSSSIVAAMQAQSSQPIKTFSIGFSEPEFNEAEYAKAVAKHLGTDHTEYYVTPQQALDVIPKLPKLYDEPFSDASQIPTYLVCSIARQQVTVCLSGDGGDELFSGYQRYFDANQTYRLMGTYPRWLQQTAKSAIQSLPHPTWKQIFRGLAPLAPGYLSAHDTADKLQRLALMLPIQDKNAFYLDVMSHWQQPEKWIHGAQRSIAHYPQINGGAFIPQMSAFDLVSYLPDDILVKVDRASMAVSLELRVPLLDHRLVEFAMRLPFHLKHKDGQSKWLLRQVLAQYVPLSLIDRPKMGFGVPLAKWLRGELRDWGEALLDERRLTQEGLFDAQQIRHYWEAHLSGQANWHYHLWDVLMVQAWREAWAVA